MSNGARGISTMSRRVLVIDDQPFMLKLIRYNLEKHGYDVVTETDGLAALERIDEIAPDLAILDIRMPKITGTELCSKFREHKTHGDIPILILTSQLRENSEEEAKAAGATDFMTKPFSPAELLAAVRKHLRKP